MPAAPPHYSESILIVEDEIVTRRLLEQALTSAGFSATGVGTFREAEGTILRDSFAVILLDLSLPDGDGLVLCERIRTRSRTPVIIITARGETEDIVKGLELGADDYVTKPFDVRTVVARVKAQIRRAGELSTADGVRPIQVGKLSIDAERRDVFIAARPLAVTNTQFELIHILALRSPRAVHRDVLFDELWGSEVERSEKILAVYIYRLRQRIEEDPDHPQYLTTIRGFGYALVDPAKSGGESR